MLCSIHKLIGAISKVCYVLYTQLVGAISKVCYVLYIQLVAAISKVCYIIYTQLVGGCLKGMLCSIHTTHRDYVDFLIF